MDPKSYKGDNGMAWRLGDYRTEEKSVRGKESFIKLMETSMETQ